MDLLAAFWAYEQALAANDLTGLDHWFLDAPDTLRAEGDNVLVGHTAIADFRRGRGGAPARVVERVHMVRPAAGVAVVTAETRRQDGTRGLQTQVWQHTDVGWRIAAAHVSAVAAPMPDDRPDPAVWRVSDGPLVASTGQGLLAHVRLAVKDLFAFKYEDFKLTGYEPHPHIAAPVAV